MSPKEPEFVGEVPLMDRREGSLTEDQKIGTARVERLSNGDVIAHIDGSQMTGEMLRRGFSIDLSGFSFRTPVNLEKGNSL